MSPLENAAVVGGLCGCAGGIIGALLGHWLEALHKAFGTDDTEVTMQEPTGGTMTVASPSASALAQALDLALAERDAAGYDPPEQELPPGAGANGKGRGEPPRE